MSVCLQELSVYGVRVFHAEPRHLVGVLGLPPDFVALFGDNMLVAGTPHKDVLQWALSEAGFDRLNVVKAGQGEGRNRILGLLASMTA